MPEIIKDFVKFVAEVLTLIIVFSVVLSPEGIATNTFNYFTYAEPIMLQNFISTAIKVGSQTEGNFSSLVKLTSGMPHVIKTFHEGGYPYVSVIPSQEVFLKTKYSAIDPTLIVTNCEIADQEIQLSNRVAQTVTVEKIVENGVCKIGLTVGIGTAGAGAR
jgi:hypothetical protein